MNLWELLTNLWRSIRLPESTDMNAHGPSVSAQTPKATRESISTPRKQKITTLLIPKQIGTAEPIFVRQGTFDWSSLPIKVKNLIYTYDFSSSTADEEDEQPSTTYVFSPGNSRYAYSIRHYPRQPDRLALLLINKQSYKDGITFYFQHTKINLRGFDRFLFESLPVIPNLLQHTRKVSIGLHMLRVSLSRRVFARFRSLNRVEVFDLSDKGIEIDGDDPNDTAIVAGLLKAGGEIGTINTLLNGYHGLGLVKDGVDIIFKFDLLITPGAEETKNKSETAGEEKNKSQNTDRNVKDKAQKPEYQIVTRQRQRCSRSKSLVAVAEPEKASTPGFIKKFTFDLRTADLVLLEMNSEVVVQ